jgi:hypothetical protein
VLGLGYREAKVIFASEDVGVAVIGPTVVESLVNLTVVNGIGAPVDTALVDQRMLWSSDHFLGGVVEHSRHCWID